MLKIKGKFCCEANEKFLSRGDEIKIIKIIKKYAGFKWGHKFEQIMVVKGCETLEMNEKI